MYMNLNTKVLSVLNEKLSEIILKVNYLSCIGWSFLPWENNKRWWWNWPITWQWNAFLWKQSDLKRRTSFRLTTSSGSGKVNKRLGNAKKFLQHEDNGFRSWQLTFDKEIPLLLYEFRLDSTISIKFQFLGQISLNVCLQWLNSSNHCNFPSG